jgi:hypothetical protein
MSDDGEKVLRVLIRQSAISGGELANLADLPLERLNVAMQELLSTGLISASEPSFGLNQLSRIYFNLNPSARRFAEYSLR